MTVTELPRRVLTVKQVAEQYSLCTKTVRAYIRRGILPAHRCGPRVFRIYADDVEKLMAPHSGGGA